MNAHIVELRRNILTIAELSSVSVNDLLPYVRQLRVDTDEQIAFEQRGKNERTFSE